ncbi:MAG: ATP-binding protein, partial [Bacteroidales bacterium]|nr:ATP-binding protein [Bacteroidales bacterium]
MEKIEEMVGNYSEDSIKTLDWQEHIRKRPGMYIGKLGDGKSRDDGIYVLIKEVLDNSIDEYAMGFGKNINIKLEDNSITIRDYGRGIPLGKLVDVASKMNTGAKYDSKVFKKSVGLNGVGIKAVNALSKLFKITAYREGEARVAEFSQGKLVSDHSIKTPDKKNGTLVLFTPDDEVFGKYNFINDYIEPLLRNYVYLNSGLTINFNGTKYFSRNGLLDLLEENLNQEEIYPIIHLKDEDLEIALTHGKQYNEEYYSFVNGQNTTQGGVHLSTFREAYVKTIRDFYRKDYDAADIRQSIIAAISIRIEEPIFESQTKTKLGSRDMSPDGISVRNYIFEFMKRLDDFLHKNPEHADILQKKILSSEKERKAIAGVKKLARERA